MIILLAISALALIIFCIYQIKKGKGGIFVVFSFMWLAFIFLAIPLYRDYSWDYSGLIFICITCLVFGIGESLGSRYSTKPCQTTRDRKINSGIAWIILVFATIVAFLSPISDLYSNGFSLRVLFDIKLFLRVNNYFEFQRYNETVTYGFSHQIYLLMMYFAPLCGGYLFAFSDLKRKKLLCFFSLAPALLSTLITNAKTGITIALFVWIAGLITSYVYKHGHLPRITKKTLAILFFGVFAVAVIMVVTFFARAQKIDAESVVFVIDNVRDYGFGHVQSFDRWFTIGDKNQYSLGFMTYLGITRRLFNSDIQSGVYGYISGSATNVFTVFRGTIEDFGIIGSLIYFLAYGVICGVSVCVTKRNGNKIAQAVLASCILFILYSFLISAWNFLVLIVLFPLFFCFLFVVDRKASPLSINAVHNPDFYFLSNRQ